MVGSSSLFHKLGVTQRKCISPHCGSNHRGQMRVVTIIQNAVQFILRPDRTCSAFFEIIQNQQGVVRISWKRLSNGTSELGRKV